MYKLFDVNVMGCNKANNNVKRDYFKSRKNCEKSFEEECLEEEISSIQVPILKTSFNKTETGGC